MHPIQPPAGTPAVSSRLDIQAVPHRSANALRIYYIRQASSPLLCWLNVLTKLLIFVLPMVLRLFVAFCFICGIIILHRYLHIVCSFVRSCHFISIHFISFNIFLQLIVFKQIQMKIQIKCTSRICKIEIKIRNKKQQLTIRIMSTKTTTFVFLFHHQFATDFKRL